MEILKTITEGGQIWAHRVRMAKQVLKIASSVSLILALIFFSAKCSQIPAHHYQASIHYIHAKFLSSPSDNLTINGKLWGKITRQSTSQKTLTFRAETITKTCERYASLTRVRLSHIFDQTLTFSSYTFTTSLLFFLIRGWRARRKQHVEGKQVISDRKLALKLTLSFRASPLKIGSIPLVKNTETHHTLVSGATGTGKTNAFHILLPQIRKLRQRAIIVDLTGEYVEKYFRPGKDILFNPFDKRSVSWHPWSEGTDHADLKSLAQSFIPSSYREEENFWRKGAQEVFFAALKEMAFPARTSALTKLLLHDSLATLATVLKGTAATAYLDLSSEKTAGSVRAVASSFLECLELLPDTETPFSIRDWVAKENSDSWLFLCCTPQHRASVSSLISAWLSVGISSLLRLPPNHERRLWFVLDELPKLNRLKDLENFLTESRKFGGCGLLAIQSPAQLETIYGREVTSTLLGNCATRIAFAEYDAMIAERISKTFGQKEIRESQEALSYGAHEMRDGVNISYQTKSSSVVSPTALQSLGKLEAFVKLPGNLPVSKVKLPIQILPKISDPFVPLK
jgi:type IV conjugative transfer system coupling protein TraD